MNNIRPDLMCLALLIGLAGFGPVLGSQTPLANIQPRPGESQQQLLDQYDSHGASYNKFAQNGHETVATTSPADYFWPDTSIGDHYGADPSEMLSSPVPERDYLNHDLTKRACKLDRGCQRKDKLNNTYLINCSRYKLESLLSNQVLMSIMHRSSSECESILGEFIQLDVLISQFDILFKNLLTRYNCHNGYSVKWTCEDCKRAYKDWLCATNLPYYMNGERIKPCISFCERVEQRCPYLHPITKEQYGGQPVFICRDPNIPFITSITPDIPFSEPAKCYDLCHLSENATELLNDSLSKYDFGNCPDKSSIAEEVRSDSSYCDLDHSEQLEDQRRKLNYSKPGIEDFGDPATSSSITDELSSEMNSTKTPIKNTLDIDDSTMGQHVHIKKLTELREVLTVYKNQPKTHKFGQHIEHR